MTDRKARHRRVMKVFDGARALAGEERNTFLKASCGSDELLVDEVLELLEHHDRDSNIADHAAGNGIGWFTGGHSAEFESAAAEIGRYRVLRKIGEGGMGLVFEAQQENPKRSVALKVLRGRFFGADTLRRFQHEAELLGRLQHPAIAQVHEAGALGDGDREPFIAMELVRGESLDHYAAELGDRERLELVAKVCDGVQHAHQNGVIHRDLKPGNILVEAGGQPKILDFGVARLCDSESRSESLQTAAGRIVGTLTYMSPEQVEGDSARIDTRSDVYALGVILYEILCGTRPLDFSHSSMLESIRRIREEDPPPLSSIAPRFAGDVEAIVHMALAKEKRRRYASAAGLATDIRRFLRDETVLARPATTWYVLSKFTRRHRPLVLAAAATVLSLVGGLAFASYGLVHATRERNQARAAREESEAVTDFLVGVLETANPLIADRKVTVDEMLDTTAPTIEHEFRDRPGVRARLQQTVGRAYQALGEYARATEYLNAAHEWASDHLEENDARRFRLMAECASLEADKGNFETSSQLLASALERAEAALGPEDPAVLKILEMRASANYDREHTADAERDFERALKGYSKAGDRVGIARTTLALGATVLEAGDFGRARELLSNSLDIVRAEFGEAHDYATNLAHLGRLSMYTGHYDQAREYFEGSRSALEDLLGEVHPRVAAVVVNLGHLASKQGRHARAEEFLREGLAQYEALVGPNHSIVATVLERIGSELREQGRLDESEEPIWRAVEIFEARGEGRSPLMASALDSLALTRLAQGHLEDAESIQREAVDIAREAHGAHHRQTALHLANLGAILTDRRDLPAALEAAEEVVTIFRELSPEPTADLAFALEVLATARGNISDYEGARDVAREAVRAWTQSVGEGDPSTVRASQALRQYSERAGSSPDGPDGAPGNE